MSDEKVGEFLTEIQSLYPKFLTDVKDIDIAYRLWSEMLEDIDFDEAHRALLNFNKHDIAGYPPTFGQLFSQEEEPAYIRDESIEDWN